MCLILFFKNTINNYASNLIFCTIDINFLIGMLGINQKFYQSLLLKQDFH